MTCHQCGHAHPHERIVTLRDGREVSDYSEEWRRECEARYVLGIRSKADRYAFLSGVQSKRGVNAANRLRADIIAQLPEKHRETILSAMCGRLETKVANHLKGLVRAPRTVAGQADLFK